MSIRRKQRSIFYKAIRKLFRLFYYSAVHDLGMIDLQDFDHTKSAGCTNLTCKRLNEQDLPELTNYFGEKFTNKFKDLKGRATCIVAYDHKEPAGYTWYTPNLKEGEGTKPFLYSVYPKENCVYIFDAYVLRHKRNFFYLKKFFSAYLRYIKEDGYKAAITTVSVNSPGVKFLLSRFGFKFVDQLWYRKCLFYVTQDISALKKVCRHTPESKG